MTVSGTIAGSYNGYVNRYEVQLVYSYDQDTLANTSTVSASLQIRSKTDAADGAYSYLGSASLSFGGYTVNWNPITFDFRDYNWHTVISMSDKVIQHSDDGTKVLALSSTFYTNDSDINSITKAWANGNVTLTPINRTSTFGTLQPFVIENAWSVPINKYIPDVQDTLTISYGTFTKTISNYVSGQSIQFSAAELTTLYGLSANTATIPFTLTITTGSLGSNTATINGTITEDKPTLSATITASPNSAVSGQTNVSVTLSAAASAKKSGTIAEYVVSLGSQTIRSNSYSTTFAFSNVDGDTITVQAVDSRGWMSVPLTQTITLYPYATPTISGSINRTPTMADTSAALSLSGAYSVVPGQTLTATYKYRVSGGAWSAATTITLTYSSGSWSFSATLLDTFNIANVYEFEVTVSDLYSSAALGLTLLSAQPTIDIDTATQRVKIGGFLGSEDAQSFSAVGDIYEGGVKLEDKYAPKGSSGGEIVKLWQNTGSSDISSATYPLSDTADYYIIQSRYYKGSQWNNSNTFTIAMDGETVMAITMGTDGKYIEARSYLISGTTFHVYAAYEYHNGSATAVPAYCYPIAVYGVKL